MKKTLDHSKKTVIIADDDMDVRNTLKKALYDSDYEIIAEATNGLDLFEKCNSLCPDIAIVDIQMPTMDGIKATKMVLDEGKAKCVMMLTSFEEKEYVNGAIEAGAIGYLTKPVNTNLLIPNLDNALKKSKELYEKGKEVDKIIRRKDSLKLIDRAKLCLMENRGLSEEDAYMFIKNLAKRKKLTLESVAKFIISKLG